MEYPVPSKLVYEGTREKYAPLHTLITLKLASSMSASSYEKDRADVMELAKILDLSLELARDLHPSVRAEYVKIIMTINKGKEKGKLE